jgi:ferritin
VVEEAQHAQKIIDFLVDNDVEFDLPALKATSTRFGSPLAAAKRALESERTVAEQFDKAAGVAVAAADHRGFEFLQWFIAEQVEEERKLQRLVDLIDSGINLFQAEGQLDAYE